MTGFKEAKIARQSAGTSSGGQFATKAHSRPDAALRAEGQAVRAEADESVFTSAGEPGRMGELHAMDEDARVLAAGEELNVREQQFLADNAHPRVRGALADNPRLDPKIRAQLASDDDRLVRLAVAASVHTDRDTVTALASDSDPTVSRIAGRALLNESRFREPVPPPRAMSQTQRISDIAAAGEHAQARIARDDQLTLEEQELLSKSRNQKVRAGLARNDMLDVGFEQKLAKDRAESVRLALVGRQSLDPDTLEILKKDKSARVRSLAENWSPR